LPHGRQKLSFFVILIERTRTVSKKKPTDLTQAKIDEIQAKAIAEVEKNPLSEEDLMTEIEKMNESAPKRRQR
jgi:hypothetical protein